MRSFLKIFSLWFLLISIFLFVDFSKSELSAQGFSIVSTSLYIRFIDNNGDISGSSFIKIDSDNDVPLGCLDSGRLIVFNHTSNDMWNVNIAFSDVFVDGLEVDPVSNFTLTGFSECGDIEFSNGSEEIFSKEGFSSVTLLSSSKNSPTFCYWYLDGVEMKNVLNNEGRGFSMMLSIL